MLTSLSMFHCGNDFGRVHDDRVLFKLNFTFRLNVLLRAGHALPCVRHSIGK